LQNEPAWLPPDEVININREAVAATSEPHLVFSRPLLESALGKPTNHFLLGIARNHPFEQGNKRTAFTSAVMFLNINGYALDAPDSDDLGELVRRVIIGEISEQRFIAILRPFVTPLP
jgi:death-on-curing protein